MIRNTTVRHIGHCSPTPYFSLSNPLQSLPYIPFLIQTRHRRLQFRCLGWLLNLNHWHQKRGKFCIFCYRSGGSYDMDFSWRIVPEERFTPFSLQECQFQEHGNLSSFIEYIQGFLYKFQGYFIRWVGNDSPMKIFR